MKYQDPLAPTDSTQFLTQTAQFTQVSTLQQIEKDQQSMRSHQRAARRERHGRPGRDLLDRSASRRRPRSPTTSVSVGGNLAAGRARRRARRRRTTSIYNNVGTKIPLDLAVHARPRTAGRCRRRASGQLDRPRADHHVRRDRRAHEHRLHARRGRPRRGRRHDRHVAGGRHHARDGRRRPTRPRSRWARAPRSVAVLEQNGDDGSEPRPASSPASTSPPTVRCCRSAAATFHWRR